MSRSARRGGNERTAETEERGRRAGAPRRRGWNGAPSAACRLRFPHLTHHVAAKAWYSPERALAHSRGGMVPGSSGTSPALHCSRRYPAEQPLHLYPRQWSREDPPPLPPPPVLGPLRNIEQEGILGRTGAALLGADQVSPTAMRPMFRSQRTRPVTAPDYEPSPSSTAHTPWSGRHPQTGRPISSSGNSIHSPSRPYRTSTRNLPRTRVPNLTTSGNPKRHSRTSVSMTPSPCKAKVLAQGAGVGGRGEGALQASRSRSPWR